MPRRAKLPAKLGVASFMGHVRFDRFVAWRCQEVPQEGRSLCNQCATKMLGGLLASMRKASRATVSLRHACLKPAIDKVLNCASVTASC